MSSVMDFMMLETAFTIVQFAIVSPLIALAYRGASDRALPADRWERDHVPHDPHLADRMRAALQRRAGITETQREHASRDRVDGAGPADARDYGQRLVLVPVPVWCRPSSPEWSWR